MKKITFVLNHRAWDIGVFALLACVFAYLVLRHSGLNPSVFGDEWVYSNYSRLSALKDAVVPSYLYLWIFRSTNACGDGFLDCARVLNTIFLIGAAPFIYLLGRSVCNRATATLVAVLAVLAPLNSYVAYFMPESMYFFGFWALAWVALNGRAWHWARYGALCGALLGAMALVKAHALFLLPALLMFIAARDLLVQRPKVPFTQTVGTITALVAAMATTRLALGFALVGAKGLTLFGTMYESQTGSNTALGERLLQLLSAGANNFAGHLMALVLLYAVPLALLAALAVSRSTRARVGTTQPTLALYSLFMLGMPILMTVAYTAMLQGHNAAEGLRLHLRYYSFALPLLLLVAAAALESPDPGASRRTKLLIAVAGAAALVYGALHLTTAYSLNIVDAPDLDALFQRNGYSYAVTAGALITLTVWMFHQRIAAGLFLFVFAPLCVVVSDIGVRAAQQHAKHPTSFDLAGKFAHQHIAPSERGDVAIAGTGLGELYRAQFHLDNPDATLIQVEQNAPITPTMVPARKKWLLVVGPHALPPGVKVETSTPDYQLVQGPTYKMLALANLSGPLEAGPLERAEGLSGAEAFGRWSDAKQIVLHFKTALPKNLTLILKAYAFGPNADQPFTLHVGQSETAFRVGYPAQEVVFRLQTDGTEKTVTIDVPQPISPKQLGIGTDARTLGLAVISVEVGVSTAP